MSSRPGFWRRQFLLPPSTAQTVWDAIFGILMPLVCLAGDWALFGRNGLFEGSIFGRYRVLAHTFILTQVALLGLWLLLRRKASASAAYFSGPFLAGWVFSLGAGFVLLPFSLVGLLVLVGALGLTPLFTFFTFYRNWKMARLLCAGHVSEPKRLLLTLAGIVFALAPALGFHAAGGPFFPDPSMMESGLLRGR